MEAKPLQLGQPLEVHKPGVSDLGAGEIILVSIFASGFVGEQMVENLPQLFNLHRSDEIRNNEITFTLVKSDVLFTER